MNEDTVKYGAAAVLAIPEPQTQQLSTRRLVRGITDRRSRMPVVGKLRMGERSKERKGAPIAYWHFETREDKSGITLASAVAAFEAVYPGGKPEEIKIMFPLDDEEVVFPIHYELWTSGSKCICRGDGYRADRVDNATGENMDVECNPDACSFYADGDCKHVGRMFFLLPGVRGLGVWQLDTRGWNCFQNVLWMIDFLKGITQARTGTARFALIPLTLSIRPHEAVVNGETKTVPVLHVSQDTYSFEDVMMALPSSHTDRIGRTLEPAALVMEAAHEVKKALHPPELMTDKEAAQEKARLFGESSPELATEKQKKVEVPKIHKDKPGGNLADDPNTLFWTHARRVKIDDAEANQYIKAAGGDMVKALAEMKKTYP